MTELKAETIVPQGTTITLQMYPKAEADKVIAEKDTEIRRLRRALFKACANWAHAECRWASSIDFKYPETWDEMARKCRVKAEEYK